jgi:excisionase family DNA binding protein
VLDSIQVQHEEEAMLPDDLISAKEAAKLIGVSPSSITRYRESGKLRGFCVAGSRYRYSRRDVLGLVEEVLVEEPVRTTREDEEAARAAVARMRAERGAG